MPLNKPMHTNRRHLFRVRDSELSHTGFAAGVDSRRRSVIRSAHVHITCMFTGPASLGRHASGPAWAIARAGTVHVLQGFVFDVGIGVGPEGPDRADFLGHVSG